MELPIQPPVAVNPMSMQMHTRMRVVAVARKWIGTPYSPCEQRIGRGTDCGSLLAGVYSEAGVIPPQPKRSYDWMAAWAKRDGDAYFLASVFEYSTEITEPEVLPGDVVMYKIGRGWSHAAIVASWPNEIIHARRTFGVISEHGLSTMLRCYQRRYFTPFGDRAAC